MRRTSYLTDSGPSIAVHAINRMGMQMGNLNTAITLFAITAYGGAGRRLSSREEGSIR